MTICVSMNSCFSFKQISKKKTLNKANQDILSEDKVLNKIVCVKFDVAHIEFTVFLGVNSVKKKSEEVLKLRNLQNCN